MNEIQAKLPIAVGADSGWIQIPADSTNFHIGVDSGEYSIDTVMSSGAVDASSIIYPKHIADWYDGEPNETVVHNASWARVTNNSDAIINYEIWV